nr:ribonuclease H2 subunit A [Onthophagus taurus]
MSDLKISNLKTLDEYLSNQDNSKNNQYITNIPDICKESPCVLGIDEAGRGPVLGPMVYGTAFCPTNQVGKLLELQCADSKVLTEEIREMIFEKICAESHIGWAIDVISPNYISNCMLSRSKHSLNKVSMDSAIGLIKAAKSAGVNIEHIYVDTVGKPEKYQDYLLSIFPEYKITVAKKADSTYPIVSAASICAKVTRDHALKVWDFHDEIETPKDGFGSGYPGDPITKKFLAENCDLVFGFPSLVRFSWSTAEKILDESTYYVEWEHIDEDDGSREVLKNSSITSFFSPTKKKSVAKRRHEFFTQRHLQSTLEF